MAREFTRLLLRLFRGSEAELGDVLEERAAGRNSPVWLWRQVASTWMPRGRVKRLGRERSHRMFSSFMKDVQYAVRSLRHNPGFTATAILTIGLGIGINTGIFSILNGIVLRALPVPNPQELVSISQDFKNVGRRIVHGGHRMFSVPEYRSYHDATQTLSGIAGYTTSWQVTLDGDQRQEISGKFVTCNYFEVLQRRPQMGPGFASNCEAERAGAVVVLSHRLWARTFASDPGIVGRTVALNGRTFTVVGIAPEDFHDTELEAVAFFAPVSAQPLLQADENFYLNENASWLMVIGRRRAGMGVEQVRGDLNRIAARLDENQPGRDTRIEVEPAATFYMRETRMRATGVSTLVLAAFGLLLLIACANVANLFLARAAGRSKEIAIRLSLGATRSRLVQQLLTESMLVALLGGMLGSVLALWSFRLLLTVILAWLPGDIQPLAIDASPDLRVVGFALVLILAAGILFGLAPALQASRQDQHSALKQDSAGAGRRMRGWLQSGLAGVQMTLCMVLLIATGLLLRGLYATHTADPGFEYRNVAMASFDLRWQRDNAQKAEAFQRQLIAGVRALPGVASVAEVVITPLKGGHAQTAFHFPGVKEWNDVDFNAVSPEYFSLLGIPIVRGRNFTAPEMLDSPRVTIVTEATAHRYWPDRDPLGQILLMGAPGQEVPVSVIGVARDAQVSRIGQIESNYLYLPASPTARTQLQLLVRNRQDFVSLASQIRALGRELNPAMAVGMGRLEENLATWQKLSIFVTALAASLGMLALLLASLGVYGVMSYSVSRRIREFGIRLVLGASGTEVQSMILKQQMRPLLIGAGVGIALSAAVSRLLVRVLFGVSALDPLAFVAAPLFLSAVATVACILPARRALRVDPMITLRHE